MENINDVFAGDSDDVTYIIVNTIPGMNQYELDLKLPLRFHEAKGVFVEMAYRPLETVLCQLLSPSFEIVHGVDVLIEQGSEQFKIWTGYEPPRTTMRETVLTAYHSAT